MPAILEPTLVTPEEMLSLNTDALYELIDGELVEKNTGAIAYRVGFLVAIILEAFCAKRKLGVVIPEATFLCFPRHPNRVRRPDVAFIAAHKLPNGELPEGHITEVPDLAVEIVSPNDRAYDLDRKTGEYLEAGVRQVWLVNPKERTVRVQRADGTGLELRGDAELSGEDVLPGFSCRISKFFKSV